MRLLTLGCRLNQSESEETLRSLAGAGCDITSGDDADIVVVNTCTVTADASRSSRKLIRKATRSGARVVVTGCYAVAEPEWVSEHDGVDEVVANNDKDALATRVATLAGITPAAGREWPVAFLGRHEPNVRQAFKVQTGCDESCSFCIIPATRGPLESRDGDAIIDGIRAQVAAGAAEVALTGVQLGKYGQDRAEPGALAGLVRRILGEVPELTWLRLSSIEAICVDDELLDLMATEPRICKHLHVPLQSGDDRVLAEMRRPCDAQTYVDILQRARYALGDDAGLTADVLVGFPGETEAAFAASCATVRAAGLTKLHVFRYSQRPGTDAAARHDQIPEQIKKSRSAELRGVGDELAERFNRRLVGRSVPVMIERVTGERLAGTTGSYVKVDAAGSSSLVGSVVAANVLSASAQGVQAAVKPARGTVEN